MTLKSITLELARNPGVPEGDHGWRYEFRAPLDPEGYFDAKEWTRVKHFCTVKRFKSDELLETGLLCRTSGGRFYFSYRPGEEDDEPVFRFADHRFTPGEYLSVTEHDAVTRTFRVAAVRDLSPPADVAAAARSAVAQHLH